jgi:hypothetical protein
MLKIVFRWTIWNNSMKKSKNNLKSIDKKDQNSLTNTLNNPKITAGNFVSYFKYEF